MSDESEQSTAWLDGQMDVLRDRGQIECEEDARQPRPRRYLMS